MKFIWVEVREQEQEELTYEVIDSDGGDVQCYAPSKEKADRIVAALNITQANVMLERRRKPSSSCN